MSCRDVAWLVHTQKQVLVQIHKLVHAWVEPGLQLQITVSRAVSLIPWCPPLHSVPSLWLWHNYALFKDVHATILGTMIGCMIWKHIRRIKEDDSRLFKWVQWNHRHLWKKKREVTKESQNRRWWSRLLTLKIEKRSRGRGIPPVAPGKDRGTDSVLETLERKANTLIYILWPPQSRLLSCETIR